MAWTERFVRDDAAGSGDGTTNTNSGANGAWTLAEAITNASAGIRMNVRAGTYANTTTTLTLNNGGTTTAPIWWRGFKSSAGDLDAVPTSTRVAATDIPSITFTTGTLAIGGATLHQIWSNFNVVGARTAGPQVSLAGGAAIRMHRVRFENTGANANSSAVGLTAAGNYTLTACWFKASSSATRVFDTGTRSFYVAGSVFTGGGIGLDVSGAGGAGCVRGCVFDGCGSHGVRVNAAPAFLDIEGCTHVSNGGDGVNFTALPTAASIRDCLFILNGGYGINNATGTATNLVQRSCNDFGSGGQANTSGTENGFGDSPTFNDVSESSSPFVSGTNRGLVSGAAARAAGLPGLFENVPYTGYLDIGAVQEQAGGAGSIAVETHCPAIFPPYRASGY